MAEPVDAWVRLENEHPGATGVFQLRIFGESSLNLYAIIELPERRVGIQLEVRSRAVPPLGAYPSAAGFRTRAERIGDTTRILVLLEVPEFRGVFGEMCIDVLRSCLRAASDETSAVQALVDRLVTWKELFSGSGPRPLGEREQTGLFGELIFLELLLDSSVPPARAVEAWRGPFSDPHDFHLGPVHVEVKTTLSVEAATARISNLRQLDPAGTRALFLWHYSLQHGDGGAGRTLRVMVEELRSRLGLAGPVVRAALDDRLLRSRYLDLHAAEHYDLNRLGVQRARPLRVGPDFPALTRATVPGPIREAVYDLDIDAISSRHDVALGEATAEICAAATGTER